MCYYMTYGIDKKNWILDLYILKGFVNKIHNLQCYLANKHYYYSLYVFLNTSTLLLYQIDFSSNNKFPNRHSSPLYQGSRVQLIKVFTQLLLIRFITLETCNSPPQHYSLYKCELTLTWIYNYTTTEVVERR